MREELPAFSVVVPTYNRPEKLARCLEGLAALDYPEDRFEVIVVDDGSPRPLGELVHPIRERAPIELIRQENAGPASARNLGAKRAVGTYLAFTDDDCIPDPGWLTALARRFQTSPEIAIGGRTMNGLPDDPFAVASHAILALVYDFYNRDPNRATFFASNNFALSRGEFLALGGFDESFPQAASEDRDLCDRWVESGRIMAFEPDALVHHFHDLNLRRFCRQHFNYGRGAYRFHRLRVDRGSKQSGIEANFHVQAMQHPFRTRHGMGVLAMLSMLVVWQGANAAGFAFEGLRERVVGRG